MPVKIVAEPSSDIEEREASRLSQREGVKRKLAQMAVKEERVRELRLLIRQLDQEDAAATAKHAEETAKIDAELNELDAAHIQSLLSDSPLPKSNSEKRRALLVRQQEADRDHTELTEADKRSRAKLAKQAQDLELQCSEKSVLLNRLFGELGKPELRDRLHCLMHRQQFASLRMKAAQNDVERNADYIDQQPENASIYGERIRKHQLCVRDAVEELEQCKQGVDALIAEMRAE